MVLKERGVIVMTTSDGRVVQWLERFSDKEEVAGSIPAAPTDNFSIEKLQITPWWKIGAKRRKKPTVS